MNKSIMLVVAIVVATIAVSTWLVNDKSRRLELDNDQQTSASEHDDGHDEDHHDDDEGEPSTTIPDAVARDSGIGIAIAGPAIIEETIELTGTVQAVPSRLAEVRPRFAGIVRSIRRDVGDKVRVGDVLATVENNESLRNYQLTAPIAGIIVARDIQVGQVVGGEPLFRIVDLSTVWVQLDVFGRNTSHVRPGQAVRIKTLADYETTGAIEWLSPLVAHGSQSLRARVPLANPDGLIRPGQYVRGIVTIATTEVPVAVQAAAIQLFRDANVVFEKLGESYETRTVTLGRADAASVEILEGIASGDSYVAKNSFLIKADIEKSGASHEH
jgi:cobalt-zinc-cadmium efflux system membrane fusion protein